MRPIYLIIKGGGSSKNPPSDITPSEPPSIDYVTVCNKATPYSTEQVCHLENAAERSQRLHEYQVNMEKEAAASRAQLYSFFTNPLILVAVFLVLFIVLANKIHDYLDTRKEQKRLDEYYASHPHEMRIPPRSSIYFD